MPGVGFTKDGGRMGHGMGYYDKFLADLFTANPQRRGAQLRKSIVDKIQQNKTILLGLAFKIQVLDELPLDPLDVLLDEIITA